MIWRAESGRHVYYTDQTGEVMLPWNFKVVERTFLTKDEHHVMLATVETSEGKRHITFAGSQQSLNVCRSLAFRSKAPLV